MATASLLPAQNAQTMPAAPASLLTVEEYLCSSYDPDVDYVDGHLEERNLGEWEHARLQAALTSILFQHEDEWGIQVAPEARLQVSATRFRVPDVTVLRAGIKVERIVMTPPLLCIEILSPGDTWQRTETKIEDYVQMGVEHLWAIDPESRQIVLFTAGTRIWFTGPELTVPGTSIRIALDQIFAAIPRRS